MPSPDNCLSSVSDLITMLIPYISNYLCVHMHYIQSHNTQTWLCEHFNLSICFISFIALPPLKAHNGTWQTEKSALTDMEMRREKYEENDRRREEGVLWDNQRSCGGPVWPMVHLLWNNVKHAISYKHVSTKLPVQLKNVEWLFFHLWEDSVVFCYEECCPGMPKASQLFHRIIQVFCCNKKPVYDSPSPVRPMLQKTKKMAF